MWWCVTCCNLRGTSLTDESIRRSHRSQWSTSPLPTSRRTCASSRTTSPRRRSGRSPGSYDRDATFPHGDHREGLGGRPDEHRTSPRSTAGPGLDYLTRLPDRGGARLGLLRHRHLADVQRPRLRAGDHRRLRGGQEGVPRHAHRGAQARLLLPDRAGRRLRRRPACAPPPSRRATSTSSTAPSASSPTARTPTGTRSTRRPTRTPATAASPPSSSRATLDGVTVDKKEDKLGQRASDTAMISFNDVEIPADNLLGEENKGFKLAMMTLDRTRPGVAAMARRHRAARRSSSPATTPRSACSSACRSRCTRRSSS